MSIALPSIALRKRAGLYDALQQGNSEFEELIGKDMTRTLRNHEFFDRVETQQSLFNVLKAYAVFVPEFGYQQGVGYIASVLLLQFGEEEAFWVLDYVLRKFAIR